MANVLPRERQIEAMRMLVEGMSLRSIERLTGIQKKTVARLMVRFGEGCRELMDGMFHNLALDHLEIDEIWTFCKKKQRRLLGEEKNNPHIGDQYLFIAIDEETKLIPSYALGKRNGETTELFIDDLAKRIILPENPNIPWSAKPRLSTDGWASYPECIMDAFGGYAAYGQIIKNYEGNAEQVGRYAPPDVVSVDRRNIRGINNVNTICTSHVERNNLTIRHFVKRFTRLTPAFSKKFENLSAAVAIHVAHFNFCWRPREKGKSGRLRLTPALAAGVVNELWDMENLFDAAM